MIAYQMPTLNCECGVVLCRDDVQPRLGGRLIYRCLNSDCRYYNSPFAFRPVEHKGELA